MVWGWPTGVSAGNGLRGTGCAARTVSASRECPTRLAFSGKQAGELDSLGGSGTNGKTALGVFETARSDTSVYVAWPRRGYNARTTPSVRRSVISGDYAEVGVVLWRGKLKGQDDSSVQRYLRVRHRKIVHSRVNPGEVYTRDFKRRGNRLQQIFTWG
ncbi:hypothetical protein GOBAR_AA05040 [Gossypium barbadense]|uniref:Uncharacterized protein n=1 Tax=Gossypium barbadense TaxID=3634 RepID=A0A2P5YJ08_GOSBA|nr:hypothetical protein GOBAR_AA05040 [Gossypium barbadense]